MEQSKQQSLAVVVLRWVAVLPAAVLGSMLTQLLYVAVNDFFATDAEKSNPISAIFILIVGNILAGGAFVYISVYVSPYHERQVALISAGLFILLSGILILYFALAGDWLSVAKSALSTVGAYGVAYDRAIKNKPLDKLW